MLTAVRADRAAFTMWCDPSLASSGQFVVHQTRIQLSLINIQLRYHNLFFSYISEAVLEVLKKKKKKGEGNCKSVGTPSRGGNFEKIIT